jgi:acyl-CoA thioester hydrolase
MTTDETTYSVQTRWRDVDGLGHVNHSVFLTYLEVGRDAYLRARGIGAEDYVIRHCEVSYLLEVGPQAGHVLFRCDALTLGTKSVRTTERLLDPSGTVVVEAEFTLVMWDPAARTSRALTDVERHALAGTDPHDQP